MPPRVFVTRRIPAPGLDLLRTENAEVRVGQDDDEAGLDATVLGQEVRRCDALLCLLTERIDHPLLESAPDLLGVANLAVGYDNIDVEAATDLGIPVSNTPGVLTDTTADFTWAMILAVARHVPQAHAYAAADRFRIWGPNLFLGLDVSPGGSGRSKVLGVVGYGAIGRAVAKRAAGFDMEVLVSTPRPVHDDDVARVPLTELLARSDFVSLHCPLNSETHHLIDGDALRRMKPTACLINAARGPIVDEAALEDALRDGRIAGAALDVFEEEPRIRPGLRELNNVVLFPHIASASHDTRGAMAVRAATNALAHARGKRAPQVVNPSVYETKAYRRRLESRGISEA